MLDLLLPQVVVFDTNIPFQLAFYALVEHGKKMYHHYYHWSCHMRDEGRLILVAP